MGLEQNNEQHYRQVVDKFIDPSTNFAMSNFDYVVRPVANNTSGAIIVVLPPVAEAKGRFYSIIAREADIVNTVTITHRNDSECWIDDITLDGKCDRVLLYSDGLAWHPLGIGALGGWPGVATTRAPYTQPPTSEGPTSLAPTSLG